MDKQETNNIVNLMKELTEIQSDTAKLKVEIFENEGNKKIEEKVQQAREIILQQANLYGQKKGKIDKEYDVEGMLNEYRTVLDEINTQYENRLKNIMQEQQEIQLDEQDTMIEQVYLIRDKVKKAVSPETLNYIEKRIRLTHEKQLAVTKRQPKVYDEKDAELAELIKGDPLVKIDKLIEDSKNRRQEIKGLLDKCEEEIEQCSIERNQKIDEVAEDRINKLVISKKENIFQKVSRALFNKINGNKKFKNNVIDVTKNKINKIKTEDVPVNDENVKDVSVKFSEGMEEKKRKFSFRDRAVDTKNTIKEKVINRGKESFSNIINRGKQSKISILQKSQTNLQNNRNLQAKGQYNAKINESR